MRVFLACDHAGFALKERVKKFLLMNDYELFDYGPYVYDPQDDYPDAIQQAMEVMAGYYIEGEDNCRGIIFGGSGQGEAMCANRFPGIRATVYYGNGVRVEDGKIYDIIGLSREHNNANVLSIGARFVDYERVLIAINQWLSTPFSEDERHIRRIKKLDLKWPCSSTG